jgi:hypothetical protein
MHWKEIFDEIKNGLAATLAETTPKLAEQQPWHDIIGSSTSLELPLAFYLFPTRGPHTGYAFTPCKGSLTYPGIDTATPTALYLLQQTVKSHDFTPVNPCPQPGSKLGRPAYWATLDLDSSTPTQISFFVLFSVV